MKNATVQARIQSDTKIAAEAIIRQLGLNSTQVINALYAQIIMRKGIPFELSIPNEITLAAINELEQDKGHKYHSMAQLWDEVEGDKVES